MPRVYPVELAPDGGSMPRWQKPLNRQGRQWVYERNGAFAGEMPGVGCLLRKPVFLQPAVASRQTPGLKPVARRMALDKWL